jgi:hypothetical protein
MKKALEPVKQVEHSIKEENALYQCPSLIILVGSSLQSSLVETTKWNLLI